MKIALFIEQGREQIVLTGETETENNILSSFKHKHVVSIYEGSFYGCQGGWTRKSDYSDVGSLILVIDHEEKVKP